MAKRKLKNTDFRPTMGIVQKSLLEILKPKLPGANFLELFAGSGKIGIAALKAGAEQVTFVEKSPRLIKLLAGRLKEENLREKAEVWLKDVKSALFKLNRQYQIIFLDPPYAGEWGEKLLELIQQAGILSPEGWVVIEHQNKEPLNERIGELVRFKQRKFGQTLVSFYHAGT